MDVIEAPLLTPVVVGQTVDRLAFQHAGLGQVQLDLVTESCVLHPRLKKNHSTQDSHVVPHHGTNWAALWFTSQIGRDAVLSKSYGRG